MYLWVHYTDMVIALLQLPVAAAVWWAGTGPGASAARPSRTAAVAFLLLLGGAALRLAAGVLLLPWGWEFAGPRLVFVAPALVVAATVYLVWLRPAGEPPGEPPVYRSGQERVAAVVGAVGVVLVAAMAELAGTGAAAATGLAVLGASAMGWAYRKLRRRPAPEHAGWRPAAARVAVGVALVVAVAAGVSAASVLPARSSMTGGAVDTGGGAAGHQHRGGISVTELTGADTTAAGDVAVDRFTLTAQEATVRLDSGEQVAAWTFNGATPGPQLVVRQGDLVEVTLVNRLPGVGVTVHWHGVDVPNAMDGVAGVTQDAVAPGATFVYRFRAVQAGTYWYHSHEMSSVQVRRGLFGALVVLPRDAPVRDGDTVDETVLRHTWGSEDGVATLGLGSGVQRRAVPAGRQVRLRLVNTDGDPATFTLTGAPVRVAAIDGTDVHEPGVLPGARILVGGGARYDLVFTMPDQPVTLRADGPGIVYSPHGDAGPDHAAAPAMLDPARYGTPAATAFGTDSRFDRRFTLRLDERLGFYDGRPAVRYTLNDATFPDVPMLMVSDGDLVEVTYINRSGQHHPMHLHGHHMLVLARNGRTTTGSPWWVDTLDAGPGETYRVAFRADNPGMWMDHCHNLEHAANGMILHLGYTGVTSPFQTGSGTVNHPE
ncbi:multicopper oxidase family protein [Dactylosporangium sp. NPDC051485]|uniref:multicopper oxidase family protein n=1 Tax=Dactylosporangium sp. NPDC051485 TaxID=3154846 RepID=UPI00344050DB